MHHIFASCVHLRPLWSMIASWWEVHIPNEITSRSLIMWPENVNLQLEAKHNFEAVIVVAFWSFGVFVIS